ncbi:trans-aconitate 2-methyltransferase [Reyranella sp. CPCC 100927]|uniref:class I SAM-dependent methyltransferase n=1 Tax=Reyranella sp. CPCC 100927 TaxID=2599616 RepID=UPI0011B6E35E|nr:class I SAM-dependent methyltransferase [Reyranella sp. CPCC 100927]TWT15030.1 class I SAM-dependent methyltransferase [Reyranella sp. CPCC 100927]
MDHPARGDVSAYQRYFAGMDASMDQKAAFLAAHLVTDPGARILDLGCGSGALSARLALLAPGAHVVGVDIDPQTVALAGEKYQLPNLSFEVGDAAAVHDGADAVVSCSMLHHVYTYGPRAYDEAAAEAAVRAHIASLRPGGLLVLRDFCVDGAPEETCLLDVGALPGSDGRSDVDMLRDFAVRARPLDALGSGFPLEDLGETGDGFRRFRLLRRWSAEFLLRKDYRTDWEIELREQYAFWTVGEFARVAERAGTRVIRAAPIHNPWILQHRFAGRVRRFDERLRPLPWPATNVVLVAQRVAPGRALRLREQRLDDAPPTYLRQTSWTGTHEVYDLIQRPTGAIDFLPYAVTDGRLRVLARSGWPRPAMVMMRRGGDVGEEIRSGHAVEMISLATDGRDPGADFLARSGLTLPQTVHFERLLTFLSSAGMVDEATQGIALHLPDLPASGPAPRPPELAFDAGTLQSFDAQSLLRAAEVGMLPEGRLELMIRALSHKLDLPTGVWAGESFTPSAIDLAVTPWDEIARPAGTPFAPTNNSTGFLRRIRSVFSEERAGPRGPVPGARQALEMAIPARHGTWTVSALPVYRDTSGRILIGIERRVLPAAQLRFGDAGLPCVPAWRVALLPDAPDPLRQAAADAVGCPTEAVVRLGAPYHPSLGITPERVQPFVVAAGDLPQSLRASLAFATLESVLARAGDVRDGHLLIAAFRLAGMLDLA